MGARTAGIDPTVRTRLDALLDDRGLSAVWFGRPSNFAWVTGGSNVVDDDAAVGVAAAGYDGQKVTVVTSNVEADRLRAEELPSGVAVESFPWHEQSLSAAVAKASSRPAGADFDVDGLEMVTTETIRQPLTDRQIDRYRRLGSDVATAVEAACRACSPTTTERELAAALRRRLAERGVGAPVVLVGGGERAPRYRHFTPTDGELGAYALASVTARRGGLYASCTRTVAFDAPGWLRRRHRAAARVEASAIAATQRQARADGTAADVFGAIRDAYAAVGWDGEWERHHQGGAAGFAGREWIATPTLRRRVHRPMAYAYNPTVAGAKSEDTTLVTDDGIEVLTATGEWPTLAVESVEGDLTLDRPAVLDG